MIRTSKHNISNITNKFKLMQVENLFVEYKTCLEHYINLIIKGDIELKKNLSSKDIPAFNIEHSRYKQLVYKQASEIVRSNTKKSNNKRYNSYKKIYTYFKNNHPNHPFVNKKFSELKLKNIVRSKYFIKPNINNITINLDERFFDIKNNSTFDSFIKIILPFFNVKKTRALQVKIPLKQHKHSNKFIHEGWKLRNAIQLKKINNKIFINLIWEKEIVKQEKEFKSIGLDIGYKKLIVTSDKQFIGEDMINLYKRISNKKQGSKSFNKLLTHRDNMINYHINNMEFDNLSHVFIEDLLNVKHKSKFSKKFNNKLQRWSYRQVINKLERLSEESGIILEKVSPEYTSQECCKCGSIHRKSRKREQFKCIDCGYEVDADYNASININSRGVYSVSGQKEDIYQ